MSIFLLIVIVVLACNLLLLIHHVDMHLSSWLARLNLPWPSG